MCGIVGIYSRNGIDREQVKKATDVMEHRGPDGFGYYFDDKFALGHRRLKIIDLSDNAKQPMSNENGDLWIVFNGEIYNFQELRKELEPKHKFKSKSDTEVILHAYEEWGPACVEKFNGMWAFAIWNAKQKELFLARDRLGVKPLYYYLGKDRFIFASEIKAILEFGVPRQINKKILYDYFNYLILIGDETLFENIKAVPPAHYFVLQGNKVTAKRYWDIEYTREQRHEREWVKEIQERFKASVQRRLISDVPIGAFVSGGIDSSLIVACMKQLSENVQTFCIGSGDNTELKNAILISEYFNTEHYETLVTAEDFAKNLPKMIWHYDMPVSFASSIPLYFVSKLTKGKATVVLTGEGADELFAGYNRYSIMKRAEKSMLKFLPKFLKNYSVTALNHLFSDVRYRKYAEMLLNGFDFNYATGINAIIGKERGSLLKNIEPNSVFVERVTKILYEKDTDFLNKVLYLDLKTYLVELLMKQDKMSMAASIESRVPFLDYSLVEFSTRIPSELKLNGKVGKYLLKKSAEGLLPKQVIYQKKVGFPVPLDKWFRQELSGFVRDELLQDSILKEFFDTKEIERMIERQKRTNCSQQLWAILNFKIWHEQFFKE